MRSLRENHKTSIYKERTFLELLDLIYDASSNPKQWPIVMEKLDQITDGALLPAFSKDLFSGSLSHNVTFMPRTNASPSVTEVYELAARLAPHIQRAIRLHRTIADLQIEKDALAETLDRLALGVILIRDNGTVLMLNRSARSIVEKQDGIRLHHDRLCPCGPHQAESFQRLISRAIQGNCPGSNPTGGTLLLSRQSPKEPLFLMVASIPAPEYQTGRRAAAAAIFVSDPGNGMQTPELILRQLYGLTRTEARIVSLLVQGKTVEEAAAELQSSPNTARTHLKKVFFKTDTRRQSDLIRLLLTGPALLRQ